MLRMRGVSIGLAFLGIIAAAPPAIASSGDHAVISEIQIGGANAKDEFIELYNPTATPVHLEGWRLSKRTGSGAREENLVATFPALDIAAHASVLVAHPGGAFAASADQKYTTQSSLANDNTVVLYGSIPAAGGDRPVVDLVGYGTVTSKEGAAAPNPPASQSLERKPGGADGNGQDTGDNAADFVVQAIPTPQGASAAARPAVVVTEPSDDTTAPSTPAADVVTPTDTATTADNTTTTTPSSGETTQPNTATPTTETTTNSTSAPLAEPSPIRSPFPAPTHVRINEFVADPAEGDEWIELVNIGPVSVNLADWVIEDGAEARTALSGAIGIGEQRFTVIAKPKGQLNNSGDRIVLKNPSGNIVDAVTYGDWNDGKASDNAPTAADPASVARVSDGADTDNDRFDFVRTESPTRGQPNIVGAAPSPDPDGDAASRARDAAPPAVLVVLNELYPNPPGDDRMDEYVELVNLGRQSADLREWRIRDELGAEYVLGAVDGTTSVAAGGFLILPRSRTGIALNDTGGETIRLYKPGQERASSVAEYAGGAAEGVAWARASDGRWHWTTERTPDAANVIAAPNRPPDAVLAALSEIDIGAVVSFDGSDSADPDREPIAYLWDFGDPATEADLATEAIGRYVYERPGTYVVTLTVTDARGATAIAKRKIAVRASVVESVSGGGSRSVATIAGEPSNPTSPVRAAESSQISRRRAATPAIAVALRDLPVTEVGTRIIVRGVVTAPPGSVGAQTFHIADEDAGVEVYVGKRAITALTIGDRVEVRGELREVTGGLRIGIAAATDVHVVGSGALVAPEPLRARDANAERLGAFVTVAGDVVDVRGRVVSIDDGTDELRITLPADAAPAAAIARGDAIRAAGILHRTSAGYRVLARSAADITTVTKASGGTEAATVSSSVSPATSTPLRNDFEYALLGGGGGALLASSLWRRRLLAFAFTATRKILGFRRPIA